MTTKKPKNKKIFFSPQLKQKVLKYFQEGKSCIEIQKLLQIAPDKKNNLYYWHNLFLKNAFHPGSSLPKKTKDLRNTPNFKLSAFNLVKNNHLFTALKQITLLVKRKGQIAKEIFFEIINHFETKVSVSQLLKWFQLSKSSYYYYLKTQKKQTLPKPMTTPEKQVFEMCMQKKIKILGQKYFIYGHRKIKAALEQKQINISTSQTYQHMKKFNLLSESIKNPFLSKTGLKKTNNNKNSHLPNLLNQNPHTNKPLEKLTTDISYLGKNLHLAAIMDLYNREIISYSFSQHPNLALVMETVHQLPTIINPCLFHSDQGTVFTNSSLQRLLKRKNLIASFSAPNRPDHNIWIENFFSNLKCETLYLLSRKRKKITLSEIKKIVHQYIFFYNHHRLSRPLNYQSPKTFLAKNLKNYAKLSN